MALGVNAQLDQELSMIRLWGAAITTETQSRGFHHNLLVALYLNRGPQREEALAKVERDAAIQRVWAAGLWKGNG